MGEEDTAAVPCSACAGRPAGPARGRPEQARAWRSGSTQGAGQHRVKMTRQRGDIKAGGVCEKSLCVRERARDGGREGGSKAARV
jgi:hypothetical protein